MIFELRVKKRNEGNSVQWRRKSLKLPFWVFDVWERREALLKLEETNFSTTKQRSIDFQSERRVIPKKIGRPDYAEHAKGRSKCEENEKSSGSTIRVLTDDEQDLLRETCRVESKDENYFSRRNEENFFLDSNSDWSHRFGRRSEITSNRNDDRRNRPNCSRSQTENKISLRFSSKSISVFQSCIENECYPSPLNYYEFPKSCCTSAQEKRASISSNISFVRFQKCQRNNLSRNSGLTADWERRHSQQ